VKKAERRRSKIGPLRVATLDRAIPMSHVYHLNVRPLIIPA
jgi:hypothetical protein